MLNGEPNEITVTELGSSEKPRLKVRLMGKGAGPGTEKQAAAALEHLLGFNIDLLEFYRFSDSIPELKELVNQFRGAKPPRFPAAFEALANAITCQQLSLTVGIRLLNRLTQAYGPAIQTEEGSFHAFPCPADLANGDGDLLRSLGYSYRKGNYLISLARAIADQQINLEDIETLKDNAAIEQLVQIHGVGRWTAEYFLLRGLGRTHIFPGDDVGARNHLQRWLGLPKRLDYAAVHQALAGWEKFGGLIYFHLLLKSLVEKGVILI